MTRILFICTIYKWHTQSMQALLHSYFLYYNNQMSIACMPVHITWQLQIFQEKLHCIHYQQSTHIQWRVCLELLTRLYILDSTILELMPYISRPSTFSFKRSRQSLLNVVNRRSTFLLISSKIWNKLSMIFHAFVLLLCKNDFTGANVIRWIDIMLFYTSAMRPRNM